MDEESHRHFQEIRERLWRAEGEIVRLSHRLTWLEAARSYERRAQDIPAQQGQTAGFGWGRIQLKEGAMICLICFLLGSMWATRDPAGAIALAKRIPDLVAK